MGVVMSATGRASLGMPLAQARSKRGVLPEGKQPPTSLMQGVRAFIQRSRVGVRAHVYDVLWRSADGEAIRHHVHGISASEPVVAMAVPGKASWWLSGTQSFRPSAPEESMEIAH